VRKSVNARGEFVCHGYYNGFDFCKFDRNRFITFKVNYKPIPTADASLNIHQLAAAKEALEKRVAELEAKNAELLLRMADYGVSPEPAAWCAVMDAELKEDVVFFKGVANDFGLIIEPSVNNKPMTMDELETTQEQVVEV
jgi:hypothetical protein